MKYILVLLTFTFSFVQAQTIKDERSVNWVYGQGNNNVSMVFNGSWSTIENASLGEYRGEYKYQILPAKNNDEIDSSALFGELTVQAFRDLPGWECLRDQLLDQKSITNSILLAVYHATTNPTRTDITNLVKGFDIGSKIGSDNKLSRYSYIIPGTFILTAGTLTVTDDGNGNLIGAVGAGTNKINYGYNSPATINVTFLSTVLKTTAITASYSYKYFPHNTYSGFIQFQDLPAKTYTFLFVDKKNLKMNANYSIQASKSLTINQESSFTYKNQLIQLQ